MSLTLSAQLNTSPPDSPVRTMAEWEELQALVITWNVGNGGNSWRNILTEITRAAREECKVIIVCSSQSIASGAQTYLTSNNVDISTNVEFLIAANNSIWVRDYGPFCVYKNDVDSLLTIDWIYNRNRPSDNIIPEKIGQYLSLPVHATTVAPYDLVNTGGNFMADGMGNAFASKLVFRNNDQIANGEGSNSNDIYGTSDHNESEIDNIMQEFMGIEHYIKMEELPYDGIHHIDMHMKLLDEETILIGEYPSNMSDGPQIEANLQYVLSQYKTAYGHDFKVVRVPMPSFSNGQYPPYSGASALYPTYANAVFVNRTIIMPSYNIPMDAVARDTFQKYMPGYKIVMVDCNSIIYSGGAVHCISKEIGVPDPLLILHSELACQDNSLQPNYEVFAKVQHRSGIASAKVFYSTDLNSAWQSVDMQYVTQDTIDVWKGVIPNQSNESTVYYYIEAEANSGKKMTRPITAPEGWWSFCVKQSSGANETTRFEMRDVYPNPASAITVVPVFSNKKMKANISLISPQGQVVENIFSGELSPGNSNYFFHADRYTPGVYFVDIQANGKHLSQKVVIR